MRKKKLHDFSPFWHYNSMRLWRERRKSLLKTLLSEAGENRNRRATSCRVVTDDFVRTRTEKPAEKRFLPAWEPWGCRALTRETESWSRRAAPSPFGAREPARSTLTKVVEASSTNWTPAAWQYNYGPCVLWGVRACSAHECMRALALALVRYACIVTTEHTQPRPDPRDSTWPMRQNGILIVPSKFTLDDR